MAYAMRGSRAMPLSSTRAEPSAEGRTLSFTMTDGVRVFRCRVQAGALDRVAGAPVDGACMVDRFGPHRGTFELVASSLHDAGLPLCITADHVSILARRG